MKTAAALPQPIPFLQPHVSQRASDRSRPLAWAALGLAAMLGACATKVVPPPPPPPPVVAIPAPAPAPAPSPAPMPEAAPVPPPVPEVVSHATTPRDYRQDGARHLYKHNGHRIFKGQMPPLMHAVGVLQVDIDKLGLVRKINWMRAPSHAPDVMQEIERTVRAAAPFPAPVRLGGVTYTDVWLWDKSGHFQLDTLTEGQRNR